MCRGKERQQENDNAQHAAGVRHHWMSGEEDVSINLMVASKGMGKKMCLPASLIPRFEMAGL